MVSSSLTPVDVSSHALEQIFRDLSDSMLGSLAETVALLRPLEPFPDWRFSSFTESSDFATHLRHSIWLAAKARSSEITAIVPWHDNTKLILTLNNDLSRATFLGGCFEPNEFRTIHRVLLPGMVFVDGGANEGLYTVFAAARTGEAGRVIAVEPSSREIRRLRRNLHQNQLSNVDVVEAALTAEPGLAKISVAEDEHSGQNTLGAAAYPGVSYVGKEEVTALTVDELTATYNLNRLDILKLDIEGAELRALSGADSALRKWKPLIVAEVNERALELQNGSSLALFDFLEAANYRLSIYGCNGELVPFRRGGSERFDTLLAVHRERDWGLI